MRSYRVKNTGLFMTKLLTKEDFDEFLLEEAKLITANTFVIDGRVQKAFFDSDDELLEYRRWKDLKGFCYEIIKGKRLPLHISIVLHAPAEIKEELADKSELRDMLKAFLLQIRYDGEAISIVTGVNISGFTMDKSAEQIWDELSEKLLYKMGIETE